MSAYIKNDIKKDQKIKKTLILRDKKWQKHLNFLTFINSKKHNKIIEKSKFFIKKEIINYSYIIKWYIYF